MSRCPNCSWENSESQHFCGECGTPLPGIPQKTMSYAEAADAAQPPPPEFRPGQLFARRYQIIEELGTGGMGRVFRVIDRKLDEEIALKLIRPEIAKNRSAVERFASELKLARHIVHRNVARMFDLNEEASVPFITMEYVRGENLKRLIRKVGRLAPGQAIPIACQICDGLAEAHRLGIVHRDLKPQNVMIDEDGQAKIMDFGLALLAAAGGTGDDHVSRSGTPAYISPEQIRGLPADGRADLYSLGVLIYEMLTGRTPFTASSVEELVDKHLNEPPRDPREINPGISPELAHVVMKCLEKGSDARYQSAREVQADLDRLRTPGRGEFLPGPFHWTPYATLAAGAALLALVGFGAYQLFIKPPPPPSLTSTIAVLRTPDAASGGTDLARHLQDILATKLAGMPELVVVPTLTVNAKDTSGKDPARIGRMFGADYLLEPGTHAVGDKVSITARLINARRNLPARTYQLLRPAADAAAEDEFAKGVATVIRYDIAEDKVQRSNKGVSSNLDARLLVHEGMIRMEDAYPLRDHPDVFAEVVGNYERALALDPDYALALWALGNAYESRYNNTERAFRDPRDVDRMCDYYQQAFDKNPNSPETNVGLGWANYNRGDFTKSFEFFARALRLEPGNAVVNLDVGAFLRSVGLYRQAIPHLERAAGLMPQDPEPVSQIAQCFTALGRFEEAASRSALAVARNPNDIRARHLRAVQLALAGRLDEADLEIEAIRRIRPDFRYLRVTEALAAAAKGDRRTALALKGDTESLAIQGTCFYILLGLPDEALANIEAGIERGFDTAGDYLYSYPSLAGNPAFESLRNLPRFKEILKKQRERYRRELEPFEDI
jgi:tetratricopeptide (TPR) repeat protein/predicted Ser/Thr protein kinase